MEAQRFEQAILKLAFETEARITTASVAYYLGIPSREANRLLNQLLEEGVLELDSDADGNLYYRIPNKAEAAALTRQDLHKAVAEDLSRGPAPVGPVGPSGPGPAPAPAPKSLSAPSTHPPHSKSSLPLVSAEGLEGAESKPYSPRTFQAEFIDDDEGLNVDFRAYRPLPGERPDGRSQAPQRYAAGRGQDGNNFGEHHRGGPVFEPPHGARHVAPQQVPWQHQQRVQQEAPNQRRVHTRNAARDDIFMGLTARYAAPDASLDRCGASPMVMSTTASCEPKPLPDSKPVVVSCTGYEQQNTSTQHDYGYGYAGQTTALAATNNADFVLACDSHIEQPEHQPGMALLLSLILCGTGQIYNGEVSKGIIMMVLCFLLWFVLLGWVVHIWSIVDAVVVAERINRKHN